MMEETIILKSPCDMHVHLRDGFMLKQVLPYTVAQFASAVVMPNLIPPIRTTDDAIKYRQCIMQQDFHEDFLPLITLFFHHGITKECIRDLKKNNVNILKLYPQGMTTNSENGIANLLCPESLKIFEIMQEEDMILCIHGETDGFVLEREYKFLAVLEEIARMFPMLRLVLEHVSDCRSIELIEKYDNLFGTITLHHLLFTLDDLLGHTLRPHLFCKPCLKLPRDQEALQKAALKAHAKFSFGSDSAPHMKKHKECSQCGAGVFSTPVLLPSLVAFFEHHDALESLQAFVSDNAIKNYRFMPPERTIILKKKPFRVAEEYQGVVSLFAGEVLEWSLQKSDT